MRLTLIFLFVVALPCVVLAQGAFVARGASGLLIGGDYVPDEDLKSYSAEIGYSFSGTFDVGVGYSWLEIPADTLSFPLSGRGIEPRIALHLAKQGTTYPFSLSVHGSYAIRNLDAMPTAPSDAEVDGSFLRIGGMLHSIVQLAEFVGIRPFGGIMYIRRDNDYKFSGSDEILEIKRDGAEYLLGAQLIFMPTIRSVVYVGPQVRYRFGERTVGVSAGLVFN